MRREHHNGSRTGVAGARSALTRLLVAAAGVPTRPARPSAKPSAGQRSRRRDFTKPGALASSEGKDAG